jgi:hypothetical protein
LAGWTVGAGGLAKTFCPNAFDGPKALFGQIAPLDSACPFGDIADPNRRGAPAKDDLRESGKLTAESRFLREQSENVYENKQSRS